jgi:hypothetical protein
MAKRSMSRFSIQELQSFLADRQADLKKLQKKRAEIQKQLDAIDAEIGSLGGSGSIRGGSRKRARNKVSLAETLRGVLEGKSKPMGVGDIVDATLASGYRSTSPNFRSIVNQTLIKEKKAFASAGRGLYQLKK